MKTKKWINVIDKRTYLYLLLVPFGFIFIALAFMEQIIEFGIAGLLFAFVGVYLFIKDNTYSEWMNPNHPH